ncbi:DUF3011 domain-containing protein [Pseudoxanthomonas gei]|uniref:DUF3011 domain-containing protein n=1 Tax=Pseudoxanthomonas gei TaxID=1383030 RepID=A0ABX0A6U1_9GAMM|nr:DUF3011 domain-containing protein [Pseudoxanthomonas gei]NDK37244.1 DUF3011 domain-containing protein [Pseudoxanthomonas gei]
MKVLGKNCAAGLVLAVAINASLSAAPAVQDGMRFRCEAERSQQHYCSVDTRNGITLVKQLSGTPCLQGRNWDYDRHGVWVSHRCRAEFISGTLPPEPQPTRATTVRCESRANRIQHCAADTRKGVRLTRLLSSSDCVENRDWGSDGEGIWTANGCRAEFALEGDAESGSGRDPAAVPHRLTCQSIAQQRQHCAAAASKGVDLIRHLSKTRCVEGANWGWNPTGVWVDNGCRAEFRVR